MGTAAANIDNKERMAERRSMRNCSRPSAEEIALGAEVSPRERRKIRDRNDASRRVGKNFIPRTPERDLRGMAAPSEASNPLNVILIAPSCPFLDSFAGSLARRFFHQQDLVGAHALECLNDSARPADLNRFGDSLRP